MVRAPNAGGARAVRCLALALLAVGIALSPLPVSSGEKPGTPEAAWPTAVHARYRLRYNGITVGHLEISSTAAAKTYSLSGSGAVSVLFGAITWSGSSRVSGTIDGGTPAPSAYAFDWHNNNKGGTIRMGFKDRIATQVAVTPPAGAPPDVVPLAPAHTVGVLDPVSAIMMLTKADSRAPCDRRVGIFDGKQRYEIVLTPKHETRLPPASGGGPATVAHVCRATYEPIAGHRANAATRTYAANRDVEVVMRPIPGTGMLIPHSVTIPTLWGTGSMVTERIDITTAGAGKIALTE